jgi:hypothetical protein
VELAVYNAPRLPSGTHIFRLRAGNLSSARTMKPMR